MSQLRDKSYEMFQVDQSQQYIFPTLAGESCKYASALMFGSLYQPYIKPANFADARRRSPKTTALCAKITRHFAELNAEVSRSQIRRFIKVAWRLMMACQTRTTRGELLPDTFSLRALPRSAELPVLVCRYTTALFSFLHCSAAWQTKGDVENKWTNDVVCSKVGDRLRSAVELGYDTENNLLDSIFI